MKTDSRSNNAAAPAPRESTPSFAPRSTYRLQLHKDFTFADAQAVSEYLKELGIGTVYTSPYLAAAAGSMHGYDVIDHSRLNPELRPPAYEAWIASLHDNGLTHLLDIVPNHMGVATNLNRWWNDVLEHGPQAEHGRYFDIAWDRSSRKTLQNKVLMPVLGTSYADALQAGKLELVEDGGAFYVAYYDRRFPLSPDSVAELLGDEPALAAIAGGYRDLPQAASERSKIIAQMKADLKGAIASDPRVGEAAKRRLAHVQSDPDRLDRLLAKQHYRLASWRTAADEINYRRFFDVDSLAALAMERPEVFEASHRFVLQLVAEGNVQGLRLDHPDGLYDPAEYFDRLQKAYLQAVAENPRGPASATSGRLYVLAEKILAMAEPLPTEWPIDGTTGYDFLVQVNALFVDTEHAGAMTDLYQSFTGETCDMEQLSRNCKLLILDRAMSSELSMLAKQLDDLAQDRRATRDFTYLGLRNALREVIASFSVYRTYITAGPITDRDRRQVMAAVEQAKQHAPHLDDSVLDFIHATLLRTSDATGEQRAAEVRFAGKFQQLTSPVTAKGIEDTAFYRYHRLISLNEVGGEPGRFGLEPDALHAYFADRQAHWPLALSTLSTHDTKRSEDVRARISVLSEIPSLWRALAEQWAGQLKPAIHRNDLYLLLQTLIGAWPTTPESDLADRLKAYMTKALREAKQRTTWTRPNESYEASVHALIDFIVDGNQSVDFHRSFDPFVRRITRAGWINSLAQTTLKYFAPGVPDTYQGTELWDYSLVDPDNRRPVDYDQRRRLLKSLESPGESLDQMLADGRAKMRVTARALKLRNASPLLFQQGSYTPLIPVGSQARHAFAFLRQYEGESLIVVVPRLLERLREDSPSGVKDLRIELPPALQGQTARHVFTGAAAPLTQVLDVGAAWEPFPVTALHVPALS